MSLASKLLIRAFGGLGMLSWSAWARGDEVDEMPIIADLRQGGHVIYLRHAAPAQGCRETQPQTSFHADADDGSQCEPATDGRGQAEALGSYVRVLGIPIGRVIADAQRGTRDTALLAFGRVEIDRRARDRDFVRALLSDTPIDRTNIVVVGSGSLLRDLTGTDLDFVESAILRPDGHGGIAIAARLTLDDWAAAVEGEQEALEFLQ